MRVCAFGGRWNGMDVSIDSVGATLRSVSLARATLVSARKRLFGVYSAASASSASTARIGQVLDFKGFFWSG